MKRRWIGMGLVLMLSLLLPADVCPAESATQEVPAGSFRLMTQDQRPSGWRSDRLLVKYQGVPELPREVTQKKRIKSVKAFASGLQVIEVEDAKDLDEVKRTLEANDAVDYVEYDYLVRPFERGLPNDPYFPQQWGLMNCGQSINGQTGIPGVDINAVPAWAITSGKKRVMVAVIDTGINPQQADVAQSMWVNRQEIPDNGLDDDDNGYIDDVCGFDFLHDDGSVYDPEDFDIHGTYVTGIIAAQTGNRLGVAGVSPGISVLPVKFMGPEGGAISDAIEGIEYARQMGAMICNLSWGGSEYSQALKDTLEECSDMLFVAAAGNEGVNIEETPYYPAAFDCDNLITVAAVDHRGEKPYWSNYGTTSVDLSAPGVDVIGVVDWPDPQPDEYLYGGGTSAAAPHVVGIAALLISKHQRLQADEVKECILDSTRPLPGPGGLTATDGLADALGALTRATGHHGHGHGHGH